MGYAVSPGMSLWRGVSCRRIGWRDSSYGHSCEDMFCKRLIGGAAAFLGVGLLIAIPVLKALIAS